MTAIVHTGHPYVTERAINHALAGSGWHAVVMHAEGGAVRVVPDGWMPWDAGVLVLAPGEQLLINGDGGLQVEPGPAGAP